MRITAEVPPVGVTTATLDTRIDDRRLVDLPLNGRNVLGLAALTPGVTRATLDNSPSDGQERINVNGNRAYSTNLTLDGAAMSYGHRGQALVQPLTSGVSAEFGRGSAMIDAVTKSGTNESHGWL